MGKRAKPGATALREYGARRDFTRTAEPCGGAPRAAGHAPIFVVQKHAAKRAGLHYDFRLEHGGVLWSWAVPKGPSLDPADRRMAMQVEDHPLDYATFEGRIPEGGYGAGTVEVWDHGTWQPLDDPEKGLRDGELRFTLDGTRLHGRFTLVRLKPRGKQRAWLLIKGHDEAERSGADAASNERDTPPPTAPRKGGPDGGKDVPAATKDIPGARKARLPDRQAPQLASLAESAPHGGEWLNEIKLDGYRLLIRLEGGKVRIQTRNDQDWTARLPTIARAVAELPARAALLDGELVSLRPDGTSSFADLQAALSAHDEARLVFYAFDLLYLDGYDLRACRLDDRKRALAGLSDWKGRLRYSTHATEDADALRGEACRMGLEGIICKRADAPYRAGRGRSWLKLKCVGRDEFIVLGWTPPQGSRTSLGALHLGYHDARGRLHYAGGVGTGFDGPARAALRKALDRRAADGPPSGLVTGTTPVERAIRWVRPELVGEVRYAGWSGAGRLRHAVWLGLRDDKTPAQVVRSPPGDATAPAPRPGRRRMTRDETPALTHPERVLWPDGDGGLTKGDLAAYWEAVAASALPGIAHRPLAIVRCPGGIEGERFFQKQGHGHLPAGVRDGHAGGSPYVAIDDAAGLAALVQVAAIELHSWGATEAAALTPDRVVFDLDPGEGVDFAAVVDAARLVRDRLEAQGLTTFCRTTGGKGLHVVAPLRPEADWDTVRAWCRAFAEDMSREAPDRFVATLPKARRRGHILIDWLRNGLGATAVASFSPRARPGATVATPVHWREVTSRLDPAAFTIRTVPARLRR
ncbi:DNA ligase D, partial [Acidisphaera rubrifaciens]|uniref:DNA ligase D n=1 Tax=Acidisphaera rubrifaciens TaxID=50715 RepID=UPI000662A48E